MSTDDELRTEFASVINRHSRENVSQTPDFIIADYLVHCLRSYEFAVIDRDHWYRPGPGEERS